MKKYFALAFLTILIIPSVASASWWNPFTWDVFRGVNTQTQIIENKMPDKAEKNADTAKTTSTTTPKATTKSAPAKPTTVKKVEPTPTAPVEPKAPTPVSTQAPTDPATTAIPPQYIDPATGEMYATPEAYRASLLQKVSSQKTSNQICKERFGEHSIATNDRDSKGNRLCSCESGYEVNSHGTSCQIQQQDNYDSDPYNVSSDSGNAYSPEELNAIDCAYYGTNCPKTNTVQINNYYQTTPPPAPTPTINCSNYQIEKNNLDNYYSQNGTLFSGARTNANNALQAKYAGCF